MIKKIILYFLVLICLILVIFYFVSKDQYLETNKSLEFFLNKNFNDFRKTLKEEDMMDKTISSLDGTIIEKNWIDAKVNLNRPIFKNWNFKGNVVFKFLAPCENKQCLFQISQKLLVDNDHIECENKLIEPIKKIGLEEYKQETIMQKDFEEKILVRLSIKIKIKRFIPFFMMQYAQNKLEEEALKRIENLKHSLIELSKKNKNPISIKIK